MYIGIYNTKISMCNRCTNQSIRKREVGKRGIEVRLANPALLSLITHELHAWIYAVSIADSKRVLVARRQDVVV